jgi:uncharacterized protein (DUF1697 family)
VRKAGAAMTVVVSMLRGVNVGGHNLIKMDALRPLYDSLGLQDPQTYAQSGNVIFKAKERDLARLARRIENEIERRFGFRPGVILRTSSDLRDVINQNPFAPRRDLEPSKLLVTFLAIDPGPDARKTLIGIKPDPEDLRIAGRELYIYFPNGMGRSKLPPLLDRILKNSGTARNWNTVTRLLAMAEKLEVSR